MIGENVVKRIDARENVEAVLTQNLDESGYIAWICYQQASPANTHLEPKTGG